MNALNVLCAQLTRDLFAIAKFLLRKSRVLYALWRQTDSDAIDAYLSTLNIIFHVIATSQRTGISRIRIPALCAFLSAL